jgi:ubiquinone/menaquinone biosynthesis C-methylase UbiE
MNLRTHQRALEALYSHNWEAHDAAYSVLDETLRPRPSSMLYDVAARHGLHNQDTLLDVGCGRGIHTCDLAERFQVFAIGVDPVSQNLQRARQLASASCRDQVVFAWGRMEALPLAAETIDFVWSRDMLGHVLDLRRGLTECRRVLRHDGQMLIFARLATPLLEPREARRLYKTLGLIARNLSPAYVKAMIAGAGLRILHEEEIGSELMEYFEERDGRCSRELLRLARMRREPEAFVARLGAERYELALAAYQWIIYQMIGKVTTAIYILGKTEA